MSRLQQQVKLANLGPTCCMGRAGRVMSTCRVLSQHRAGCVPQRAELPEREALGLGARRCPRSCVRAARQQSCTLLVEAAHVRLNRVLHDEVMHLLAGSAQTLSLVCSLQPARCSAVTAKAAGRPPCVQQCLHTFW